MEACRTGLWKSLYDSKGGALATHPFRVFKTCDHLRSVDTHVHICTHEEEQCRLLAECLQSAWLAWIACSRPHN